MGLQCYWLEPTGQQRRSLRRYVSSSKATCPGPYGYHNAQVFLDVVPVVLEGEGESRYIAAAGRVEDFRDDPRWPTACAHCGYVFESDDERQIFTEALYRRADTGEELTLREAGPGAMWNAWWMPKRYQGFDGRCLVVKCPDGHEWMIDGIASNCTDRGNDQHRCWIRHGEPPVLTVDKDGPTCGAGAGSILTPRYHGFLRNGEFVSC